jgi:hypothetical protein
MNPENVENAVREYGRVIARMRPASHEVRAALAWKNQRAGRRRTSRRGVSAFAAGIACLLLGGAMATAGTSVLAPALDVFFGGGDPPGRSLPASEIPSWLQPEAGFTAPGKVSVIASDGPEHFYAYRQGSSLCFEYGHHVGDCRSPAEWRQALEDEPWILPPPVGRFTFFGLVDAKVTSVRVDYATGRPVEVAVGEGGFVLDVDPSRDPQRIVALDASGNEVVSRSLVGDSP